MQKNFTISADCEKNLLNIRFIGHVTMQESEQAIGVLVQEVSRLAPGFKVLTDLREFILTDNNSLQLLKNSMEYLKIHQVGKIVRIVGASRQGIELFNLTSQKIQGYHAHTVSSMEDAKKYLGL